MKLNTAIYIIIVFIILTIIGVLLLTWLFLVKPQALNIESNQPTEAIDLYSASSNSDKNSLLSIFQKGIQLEGIGDLEKAREQYEMALSKTLTAEVEAHIKYRIALTYMLEDPIKAVGLFKEIVSEPTYPDQQKSYAIMRMALIMGDTGREDVRDTVLSGEVYEKFADEDLLTTYKNLFEESLRFAPNGIGEFVVAQWYAKDLNENAAKFTDDEKSQLRSKINQLLDDGNGYIQRNNDNLVNQKLIPNVLNWRARAYAAFAATGDQGALSVYSDMYEDAIKVGILSNLDGSVRFAYFKYAYEIEGEDSFAKTQAHLDRLLNDIDRYPGMKTFFERERTNFYGGKVELVALANANETLKNYLTSNAGWSTSDF